MTMKAQVEQQTTSSLSKVAKGRAGREARELKHGSIQALLDKLQDLVPNMPRNKKLTKLEVVQNVIDYIMDLEVALEADPVMSNAAAARQPLVVLSSPTNAAGNSSSDEEVTQSEKPIRHFAEFAPSVVPLSSPVPRLDL